MTNNSHAVAHSFAMYVPPRCVANQDLSQWMDTSDEWITQRTGIKTRHWVDAPTTTSDLAVEAAQQSLKSLEAGSVDAIIAATLSPDYNFPGIGTAIQHKLGLPFVPAFDLRNQCAGFLYGLQLAKSLIEAGQYQRILLVGSEVHSTGLDISTRGRDLAVLFGDGAGSCIVESKSSVQRGSGKFEVVDVMLHSDGAHISELWCEHPGSARFPTRITPEMVAEGKTFPQMNGKKVFEHAVKRMIEVSQRLLEKNKLHAQNISLFVPHQANLRINMMVGESLGFRPEQVFNTIQRFGNTTAATIPIGMTCALKERGFKEGELVLSAAFGSGFVWGAALLKCL